MLSDGYHFSNMKRKSIHNLKLRLCTLHDSFFLNVLFLNIFRISPSLPNVTYDGNNFIGLHYESSISALPTPLCTQDFRPNTPNHPGVNIPSKCL